MTNTSSPAGRQRAALPGAEGARQGAEAAFGAEGADSALGSVNVSAIEEYKEVSERYTFLKEQICDVEVSRDELLRLIDELTKKMSDQFREQFYKINNHFGG